MDFLEQTQSLLMEIDDMNGTDLSEKAVLSLDFENYDLNGLLASISSEISYDWNLIYPHDENSKDLRKVYSSASPNDPFSYQGMTSLEVDSSVNSLIAKIPCFGEWSGEVSSFDLLGQQLLSEISVQEVADVCHAEENAFASIKLPVQDSALTSFQDKLQNSLDNQHSSISSVVTDVNFPSSSNMPHGLSKSLEQPVDLSEEFLKFSSMDDLCQWFVPSQEDSICRTITQLDNNTLSESTEFNPTISDLVGSSSFLDGKETSVVMRSSEKDLLDGMGFDLGCDQAGEWLGNILTPVGCAAADDTDTITCFSECISKELNTGSTPSGTRKRLFSELGIEELLKGEANLNPFNSFKFDYELSSNKRQMVESSPMNRIPVNFANLADLMQPVSDLDKSSSLLMKKDTFPKSQIGMLIDDRHSINIERAAPVHPQKAGEPTKPTRKRARPGESTRPRPKDRQQIQDCIKELRGIIPNGGKVNEMIYAKNKASNICLYKGMVIIGTRQQANMSSMSLCNDANFPIS